MELILPIGKRPMVEKFTYLKPFRSTPRWWSGGYTGESPSKTNNSTIILHTPKLLFMASIGTRRSGLMKKKTDTKNVMTPSLGISLLAQKLSRILKCFLRTQLRWQKKIQKIYPTNPAQPAPFESMYRQFLIYILLLLYRIQVHQICIFYQVHSVKFVHCVKYCTIHFVCSALCYWVSE